MKRRILASLASRTAKLRSMRASIALSERDSDATSSSVSGTSTRRVRSPAAMPAAVSSIRVRGRKVRPMSSHPTSGADEQGERADARGIPPELVDGGVERTQREREHVGAGAAEVAWATASHVRSPSPTESMTKVRPLVTLGSVGSRKGMAARSLSVAASPRVWTVVPSALSSLAVNPVGRPGPVGDLGLGDRRQVDVELLLGLGEEVATQQRTHRSRRQDESDEGQAEQPRRGVASAAERQRRRPSTPAAPARGVSSAGVGGHGPADQEVAMSGGTRRT